MEEKKYVIDANLLRHLNEYQKGELGYKLEEIEAELAKQKRDPTLFTPETAKAPVTQLTDWEKAALAAKMERG